jgi:hypothetical protein
LLRRDSFGVQNECSTDSKLVWVAARLSYALAMLPLLRLATVGGVFIAMIALGLGLSLPVPSYARIPVSESPARGPLLDTAEHPEWRQFLILAAVRRAGELETLRHLPDRSATAKPARRVAGLPAERMDADPDNEQTGSIVQAPSASIPMDIGETSSTELPVSVPEEERPPVTKIPEHAKPAKESQRKTIRKARKGKALAKSETATTFNPFGALFGTGANNTAQNNGGAR